MAASAPPTDEEDERWVDVTEDVAGVAASLDVDELLRAPTFSLYDSMSALELMDPKWTRWAASRRSGPSRNY